MRCNLTKSGEWCGYCYAIRRGRTATHGPSVPRYSLLDYVGDVMEYIRRVVKPAAGSAPALVGDAGTWGRTFPALTEFLTVTQWDEKTARTTGTIMLMIDEGRWKAWVHDRDAKRSMFCTGVSPDGVLANVEESLANNSGEWRFDRK